MSSDHCLGPTSATADTTDVSSGTDVPSTPTVIHSESDWDRMNQNLAKIVHYYQHQIQFSETLKQEMVDLKSQVRTLNEETHSLHESLHIRAKDMDCLIASHDVLSSTLLEVMGHIESIQLSVKSIQDQVSDMSETVTTGAEKERGAYTKLARFTHDQLEKQLKPVTLALQVIQSMIEHRL